jgi:hypothetical protein
MAPCIIATQGRPVLPRADSDEDSYRAGGPHSRYLSRNHTFCWAGEQGCEW